MSAATTQAVEEASQAGWDAGYTAGRKAHGEETRRWIPRVFQTNPVKEFTTDCGPATLWKIRVRVWPTEKQLQEERRRYPGSADCCVAFCRPLSDREARETGIVAELHFSKNDLSAATIVHEVTHALVAYAGLVRLNLNTRDGDEAFAYAMEHVFSGICCALRKAKLR